MGGSKQTTTQSIPKWAEDAFKNQLERADVISQTGYTPYQGAEIAAFSPQQVNAMQSAANWSAAFGGEGAQPIDVASTIPQAQQFNDGTRGYSSYPGYLEQMAAFKSAYPGQAKYIESLAIDPQSGAKNTPGKIKTDSTNPENFWDEWSRLFRSA